MSKTNALETDLLELFFNGTAIASIADNAASPATSIWVSLHTADPGETGTQGTNETSYTGYTRIAVTRSTAGWVVTNNSVSPVATITFPQATSTSTGTLTHFGAGLSSAASTGYLMYKGAISPNINFGQSVTPRLTTGSSITED